MSGNPFRISLQQKQPAINPTNSAFTAVDDSTRRAYGSLPHINTENTSPAPAKTKKHVRITSPTSSPPQQSNPEVDYAILQRLSRGGHIGSPPPASPVSSSSSDEEYANDPFSKDTRGDRDGDGQDDEGLMKNTRMNSSIRETTYAPPTTAVPLNPFQRTLATLEPSAKAAPLHRQSLYDRPPAERTDSGLTRASLDVDAFKRLLMTGSVNPSGSGTPSTQPLLHNPITGAIVESSSSTDTSSISRQSIFEPIQETHNESPRTSYEMAGSDDDEGASLMADGRSGKVEKKKPPPPKHRHGKLVASRTPQTVSFSEFSPSFAAPTPQQTSSPRLGLTRTNSDLNKPLPPPPETSHPQTEPQLRVEQGPTQQLNTIKSPLGPSDPSSSQKRTPPAPPLARRHSTLRSSTQNRSRSNSSLTISSQISETPSPSLSEPTSHPQTQTHKAPPPPPPARRHGTGISTASANPSTTDLPSTSSSRRSTVTSPPAPASRRSTVSSPPPSPSSGLARTSSINSNRNLRSSPETGASMSPPPPPPPRRGSGRASLDSQRPLPAANTLPTESQRTSGEFKRWSLDADNRRTSAASESSLLYEYVGAGGGSSSQDNETMLETPREERESAPLAKTNTADILDDMEKLQREVDELRDRYRRVN